MENRYVIQLEDKTMVALAGFPYGNKIFNTCVGNEVALDREVTICFPDQLKRVATSFVQGFFDYWLNTYGLDAILKYVQIEASDYIRQQVMTALSLR